MDELTALVRQEIKKQYRSVRQFAFHIGIPLSTIVTSLNNGMKGTSFETVVAICKALDIEAVNTDLTAYLDKDRRELLEGYARLDEYGRHTVDAILYVELLRCRRQAEDGLDAPSLEEMQKVVNDLSQLTRE